jgi:hypothetical protein
MDHVLLLNLTALSLILFVSLHLHFAKMEFVGIPALNLEVVQNPHLYFVLLEFVFSQFLNAQAKPTALLTLPLDAWMVLV